MTTKSIPDRTSRVPHFSFADTLPTRGNPHPSIWFVAAGGTGKFLEFGIIPGIFPPCWHLKQGRARKVISYQCEVKNDNCC